jgi:aminoglycoside phosphotransferase (APT) family kinase protein
VSDPAWRTVIRWAVVHPRLPELLVLDGRGAAALPETDLPGQVWTADCEAAIRALRERAGVDALLLRGLDERDDESGKTRHVTLLAVARGEAPPPAGGAWVDADRLGGVELSARDRSVAAQALAELVSDAARDDRPPWTRRGWFPDAERWMAESMAAIGRPATGPIAQIRVWELSCVLRAPSAAGDVYLKTAIDFPLFGDEVVVTSALAARFPGQIPTLLAVDGRRRWMLIDDFGGEVGWDALVEVREDVIRTFARMQIEAASQAGALLGAGFVDRRPAWLAAEARRWLPEIEATGRLVTIDPATWLSAEEMAELRAALPRLAELCDELAADPLPTTLVHGDLHLGNVAGRADGDAGGGYVFFDWTDAAIGHPFLDLVTFVWDEEGEPRRRAVDAYLAEWAGFAPADRLLRSWRVVEAVGSLYHAISYRSIVERLVPPVERHMSESTAFWLRRALAALRRDAEARGVPA